MRHVGGNHESTVESFAKMRCARGKLCQLATSLKTALFYPEFEVFVWRGSLQNSKKLIVPYGTITFCSLKDIMTLRNKAGEEVPFLSL